MNGNYANFNLNAQTLRQNPIKTLLAGEQWKHVVFYQIRKAVGSFELTKTAL